MKKQMQERPGTWRLVIGSVLILCAQMGLAAAQDIGTATAYDLVAAADQELLFAQLLDQDAADQAVAAGPRLAGRIGVMAVDPPPSGSAGRVFNTRYEPGDAAGVYASIQAAIDDANDGDTIIVETLSGANTVYRERIDFKGKAITLRSGSVDEPNDATVYPETTFLLGNISEGSVVTFAHEEGADSVLLGLTIGWGTADEGAGISIEDASPTIRNCIITNNQATYYGGGIDCLGGAPTIVGCIISNNEVTGTTGVGGGINCQDASPTISDCTIRNNSSMSLGGGLGCYEASPALSNCFLINNSAAYGSGQVDVEDASPTLINCTIVSDEDAANGGIGCSGQSDPVITNCILWGNGDELVDCFAAFSCIEDGDPGQGNISADPQLMEGPLGLYYLTQSEAGQTSQSPCVDAGDPATDTTLAEHLRALSTRTDGIADVNTVDMGAHYERTAANLFPLTVNITVMDASGSPIDPNGPVGTVDPNSGLFREFSILELTAESVEGYRLKQWLSTTGTTYDPDPTLALPVNGPIGLIVVFEEIPMYELRTAVEGGNGAVTPDHRRGQLYPDGTVVTLAAEPGDGYIVDAWTGTDDDTLWTNGNTVTVHADTEVTVKFRKPKSLHVPTQFHTIAAAVGAASDHGDKIVVGRETYNITSPIDFEGKAITLASANPDDPECVAATVIDCGQLSRAFIFQSGEGAASVVDGFTIRNGYAVYDPTTATASGGIGTPGADAFGGAVACFNGSSPTLSNLIIEDCVAQGQNGEDASFVFDPIAPPTAPADPADAAEALPDPNEPDPPRGDPNDPVPGVDGLDGGDGAAGSDGAEGAEGAVGYDGGRGGHGYGGAFYFDPNSTPTILHCTIRDCKAFGGSGGAGGAGQAGGAGGDGGDGQVGQAGQNGGEGLNDGPAGAGGAGGAGGNGGAGGIGGNGGPGGKGGDGGEGLGGAMYFGTNCRPTILDCTILSCETLQGIGNVGGAGGAGGAGGSGGLAAEGGAGGTGETDGADGAAGIDGVGANGGDGAAGGAMGVNGPRSWGGAIFFAADCDIEISRTAISGHAARSMVATVAYAGGIGGDGGAGGSPGGNGGSGANGGDGDPAGAGGAAGAAGADGGAGSGGAGGSGLTSVTTNFGGAIAYESGCTVKMTDVTISDSLVEVNRGGGEYYMDNCTAELTRCSITGNLAGLDGGGQAFTTGCSVTLNECTFSGNIAPDDGGGFYLAQDCQVDINDCTFNGNQAQGVNASGGAFYGGGLWDDDRGDFYNGSTLKLHGSEFSENTAAFGGGLYWYGQEASVEVSDCVIWDNTAEHGGGLYWSGGAPTINNCTIRGNTATGSESTDQVPASVPDPADPITWPIPGDPNSLTDPNNWPDPTDPASLYDPDAYPAVIDTLEGDCGSGGGLLGWWSDAIITNCFISENSSLGAGGGVYLGGESAPVLKNCLVKANTATIEGGGIASYWDVSATIANCTIVENVASDPSVSSRGKGGGLSCSHGSDTELIDSILWDNEGRQGPQIAIGSDSDSVYLQRPAVLTVSYSDVQGGKAGVHVEPGRTLNWLDSNFNTDPLFTASYFLSQIEAGQSQDSPLIDAGSDLAVRLGFDAYTTRPDEVGDAGQVDIGFHYPGQGRYQLLVSVVGEHGTVTPTRGYHHEFSEVTLTATPDDGYRVREWIGTDDDPGWNQNTNVVTMDTGDKFVMVEFEENITRNLLVPDDFRTVEEAVQAASPGDTNIILGTGVYYIGNPDGIDLQHKAIRIMSADPNDPNTVADTIIDCAGARFTRKRAFHFQRGEGSDTIITGVTIRNAYWIGEVGVSGYEFGHLFPLAGIDGYYIPPFGEEVDPTRDPYKMPGGMPASGIAYGGAILCENGSSPTFRNCVIENCVVVASQGGDGMGGRPINSTLWGLPGDWGGDAGSGSGDGYGGAIACLSGSKPNFINCTIRNCGARGGMGGDGGNGSIPNQGSGWESNGGDAGDAIGDGHGGAVYCADGSDAVFKSCLFENNQATSGLTGSAGAAGPGGDLPEDDYGPGGISGGQGRTQAEGTISGGAIHQENANPVFEDCRFIENQAYAAIPSVTFVGFYEDEASEVPVYMRGGAIYAGYDSGISVQGCEFTGNRSSAIYAEGYNAVDCNDSVFSQNQANGDNQEYASFYSYTWIINDEGEIEIVPMFNLGGVPLEYSGGALFVGPFCPEVSLRDCHFYSNTSTAGGGAIRLMSDAELSDCSFSGNKAGGDGGALETYMDSGDSENPFVLHANLERCSFGGNVAIDGFRGKGGAVYFEDFEATFTDCYFLGNRAKSGGGLFLSGGAVELTGGSISGNTAIGGSGVDTQLDLGTTPEQIIFSDIGLYGEYDVLNLNRGNFQREDPAAGIDIGGGLVVSGSDAAIENCMFTGNNAEGLQGSGGAISFYGGRLDHRVKNCLFLDNNANREGGAIWAGLYADPVIANSTFAQNDAERLGGAIACDWDSNVTVRDSIFTDNSNLAIGEIYPGDSKVTHSLFFENADGDYGVYDTASKQIDRLPGAELDATNTDADPLFVEGPLGRGYLSQTEAGQEVTSPAVDAGSDLAENANLALLTTRTDGTPDTGVADLGFHFSDHTDMPKFTLTTEVVGGHGEISLSHGEFYAGASVIVTATPESGYRIAQWTGTTDDASSKTENLVVIGADKHVTVEFETPDIIEVGSYPGATTIQHAIDLAKEGDTVIVPSGTYEPAATVEYPWGIIRIHDKNITLTGASPDDPQATSNTMLHRYRFEIMNVGPETVIDGITIGDVNWVAGDGANGGDIGDGHHDGRYGGSLWGGTMVIQNASPTIRNCRFVDCTINGGDGGLGGSGWDGHGIGYDGGYAGRAYGGAVYIGFQSDPLFQNCLFENCHAIGGNGGDGGNGANGAQGGRGGNWMLAESIEETIRLWWDGWEWGPYDKDGNLQGFSYFSWEGSTGDFRGYYDEYWKYSGYGGAVYIEYYSSPRFVDCNFADNSTQGGVCGIGGTTDRFPDRNLKIENFGGAVYIGSASDPEFVNCAFSNNTADTDTVSLPDDIYVSYGGSIAFENDCRPTFIGCDITDSNSCVGGGIWGSDSTATIIDCNIAGNMAYHGGGIYAVNLDGAISSTTLTGNLALQSAIDANQVTDPNASVGSISSWGGGYCGINSPIDIYDSVFTRNRAMLSGGGLYIGGSGDEIEEAPLLHNCLIHGNSAGRDGGGISVQWFNEPMISNCTIAENLVSGAFGDAFGGGLYVGYDSNAVLVDSIVWGNISTDEGSQIAVTNGFEYGPRPSTLRIMHSDVQPNVDPNSVTGSALDLVFVIDSTDSMTFNVRALEGAAAEIVGAVEEAIPDYRMAVVDYKDFNDTTLGAASDYPFRIVTPFTEDSARIINAFNSIGTPAGAGGNTEAESAYTALINTIDANELDLGEWRGGTVNRVIMLITDAAAHDPEPPTSLTLSDVVTAASVDPSKRIFTVQIGNDPVASIQLSSLAGASGGVTVRAADETEVAEAVLEALSLITKVAPSIFIAEGSKLPGYNQADDTFDPTTSNIQDDPLFIAGYYLSQVEAGQGRQSPAVDTGSGPADGRDIALAGQTSRTDGVYDAGTVDMGYHYVEGVTLLTLTAEALADPDDGLIHGTVTPTYTLIYEGAAENVIRLVAVPEEGYSLKQWTGTDDDTLTTLDNTVTLIEDTHVTVTFEKRKARVVTVPDDYPRIQDAILAGGEGDTIVVDTGTYTSSQEAVALFVDRPVTITSSNPDDPEIVNATIIDGLLVSADTEWSSIGVIFTEGASRNTVLNGFTIQNCGGRAVDGGDGDRDAGHPNGEDGAPISGGAMVLLPGASPTIKNCVFRNNAITAGDAGSGVDADETMNAGRGGWGGWARGGAIYCAAETSPKFINCIVENNYAEGGNGGNGGAYSDGGGLANYGGNFTPALPINIDPDGFGAETATQELWRQWSWDFAADIEAAYGTLPYSADTGISGGSGSYFGDYRFYSAYGGGIYIDQSSKVEFVACTIRGNRTYGGMSGQGGVMASAGRFTEPLVPFEIPTYGGGVYCAAETEVTFTECTFENNVASPGLAGQDPNFRLDPYIGFGGGVAAEGTSTLTFVDCNFVDNAADTGGGLYVINTEFQAIDCNFASNDALRGGGIAGVASTLRLTGSDVTNNQAVDDVDDPNDDSILPIGAGILCSTTDAFIQDCNLAGNRSDGSGGAIHLRGQNAASIFNCLIQNNRAARDGGGISTNWYAQPVIQNCTFFQNTASGTVGDPDKTGLGGAIFCGYFSEATVIDSILWNDFAIKGAALAVGTGFELDPLCGTIHVSYSNIGPGPNSVFADDGCVLEFGEGIISEVPRFVDGPLGKFYLSAGDLPGQGAESPCINVGSDNASAIGMSRYTTRTDRQPDTGVVDLGFHYPFLEPCRFCDLIFDGAIRFDDFAMFALSWLDDGCSEADGWCMGADLTYDSQVDARDLAVLADCWLVVDTTAPDPDRAEWETKPYLSGSSAQMTAVEAIDGWWGDEVEYYFKAEFGLGHDSGWQSSRVYRDSGLASNKEYGYSVKARDPLGNETEWSVTEYAGGADRRPPAPAPYFEQIAADSSQAITMTATEAFDDNGVEYLFDCNTPGGHSSEWQSSRVYTDPNLEPNTVYCYRVKARDLSASANETEFSGFVCVSTLVPGDMTAPLPDPMAFDPNGLPRQYDFDGDSKNTPLDTWVEMMAVTATDDSGVVQYYFECTTSDYKDVWPDGFSSGWQDSPIWSVEVGTGNSNFIFRVRARDASGNPTEWSDPVRAISRPNQPSLTGDTTGDGTGIVVGGG